MSRQPGLSEWIDLVSTHMPHLSVPQARVLALWSYGMALTRSCGRQTVATFLALLLRQTVATVAQRLDAWCCPAAHQAGDKRQTVDVTTCCMPWLRWVVALWATTQMALALDATSVGARCVVLTVSVVDCGCASPVAWTVLPANQPGAWRRAWLRLLRWVRPAIPAAWTVLGLADRGLWARWLFRRMVKLGWHPLLRINQGAKCRPTGPARWYWLRALVHDVGQGGPGRLVELPTPPGSTRPLGRATGTARGVRTARPRVLEPMDAADCHDCSAGARPQREAQRVSLAMRADWSHRAWGVVASDCQADGPRLPHRQRMQRITKRIADGSLPQRRKQTLTGGGRAQGQVVPTQVGSPQGAPLSPLSRHRSLHLLDHLWPRRG